MIHRLRIAWCLSLMLALVACGEQPAAQPPTNTTQTPQTSATNQASEPAATATKPAESLATDTTKKPPQTLLASAESKQTVVKEITDMPKPAIAIQEPGAKSDQPLPSIHDLPSVLSPLKLISKRGDKLGKMREVEVKDKSFKRAMEVTTTYMPPRMWDLELTGQTTQAFKEGDIALLRFHARKVASQHETGEGLILAFFQSNEPPYQKSLSEKLSVGSEWTLFEQPFRVNGDYPAGKASAGFHLGGAEQTVEIASLKLMKYPQGTRLRDMPVSPRITYKGRELDAPWRKQAATRIENLRKGDLTVTVTNAEGQPVRDAKVHVKMKRHAFEFGCTIGVALINNPERKESKQYEKMFVENFNTAVISNGLKPVLWHRHGVRQHMFKTFDWLDSKGIDQRGHWLSHGVTDQMIGHLPEEEQQRLLNDPKAMREYVLNDIAKKLDRIGKRVDEWDTLNHITAYWGVPLEESAGGMDIYLDVMKVARKHAPHASLWVNEAGILASGRDKHEEEYRRRIQYLFDHKLPPDGIGMMAHFGSASLRPPVDIWRLLDVYRDQFGLPIKATELDVSVNDEDLQADYLRDSMTALFAHESVTGIVQWGFWEGAHWKPEAALVRMDFSPKPAWHAYRNLVFRDWWTDETVRTNEAGIATLRGFLGNYDVIVETPAGKKAVKAISLPRQGQTVNIVVE